MKLMTSSTMENSAAILTILENCFEGKIRDDSGSVDHRSNGSSLIDGAHRSSVSGPQPMTHQIFMTAGAVIQSMEF